MGELEIGGVSEAIFEEFNEFDCSGSDNSSGSLFFLSFDFTAQLYSSCHQGISNETPCGR